MTKKFFNVEIAQMKEKYYLCSRKKTIIIMCKQVLTKEEALKRFAASKDKKRKKIAQLEKELKRIYEEQTGLKANYFSAL